MGAKALPLSAYDRLPPEARARVDAAALRIAKAHGMTTEQAREKLFRDGYVRTVRPSHGTGH